MISEQLDYDSDCDDYEDNVDSFFIHMVGLKFSSQPDQVFVKISAHLKQLYGNCLQD